MHISDSLAEKILKNSGVVNNEKLLELKAEVKASHVPLAELILSYDLMAEEDLAQAVAKELNLPYLNLQGQPIELEYLNHLPLDISTRHHVIVFSVQDKLKLLASDSQLTPRSKALITKFIGPDYRLHIVSSKELQSILNHYRPTSDLKNNLKKADYDESRVVLSIHQILENAILKQASSIHIEPTDKLIQIRFKIDNKLSQSYKLPIGAYDLLIGRIKKMAAMDYQATGSFRIEFRNSVYRIEVLSLPTVDGENITLKIINENASPLKLDETGLWGHNLTLVENSSLLRQGLIIVSGPRGSGKKSLTYSLLESIPRNNLNVLTIEQTHLYRLKHVSQFEFGPNIDYYQALQACLKQDPDILVIDNLIGTAMVDRVIKASARCLIIAGVNNYSSLSALQSLESSDIEAFRLAHGLSLLIGLRTVRKLCTNCRVTYHPTNKMLGEIIKASHLKSIGGVKGLHDLEKKAANEALGSMAKNSLSTTETSIKSVWVASQDGCEQCNFSGFKGLVGLQEVLDINSDFKAKLAARVSLADLKTIALKDGFIPIEVDGLVKALRGLIDFNDALDNSIYFG